MACTSDDGAIGYLNAIDEKFGKVLAVFVYLDGIVNEG